MSLHDSHMLRTYDESDGLSPACHVQEIQVLPEKDYEAVKRAVYLYGGVQSSLYTAMVSDRDDTHYYRKETGAYW